MPNTFHYFAYGSNMLSVRLKGRTPSAQFVAIGFVDGYKLVFDKVSVDGSGKCDIEKTNNSHDRVWGVIFSIDARESAALDDAEGLGYGYRKETLSVTTASVTLDTVAYLATNKDPGLEPYTWYHQFVLAGAIEHDLPPEYRNLIERIPAKQDLDHSRRTSNEAVLELHARSS